jgi:hypothetical protein
MGEWQKNQTVCAEVEIKQIMLLWRAAAEFVAEGFEAVVGSARSNYFAKDGHWFLDILSWGLD